MIGNKEINRIIEECSSRGSTIRIRDIAFVVLSDFFEDKRLVRKIIFGDDNDDMSYSASSDMLILEAYLKEKFLRKTKETSIEKVSGKKDISFEENKAYMLHLKEEVERSMEAGEMDKKDGLKLLAELSVKLNDKFNVSEEVKEQLVMVNAKYDDICPYCNHEITRRVISKEEAKKKYDLIEKNDE